MKYHFIEDTVQKGMVKIQYISTKEHTVYMMTNPLSVTKFRHFQDMLVMAENVSLAEREC